MKYDDEILQVLHEQAVGMYKAGVISEARMREYDEKCLINQKIIKTSSSAYLNTKNIEHKKPATA